MLIKIGVKVRSYRVRFWMKFKSITGVKNIVFKSGINISIAFHKLQNEFARSFYEVDNSLLNPT